MGKQRQVSSAAKALRALVTPSPTRFTQSQVADSCGVSQQAVSNWLAGAALPAPHHMRILEDRFGIPMRDWTEAAAAKGKRSAA